METEIQTPGHSNQQTEQTSIWQVRDSDVAPNSFTPCPWFEGVLGSAEMWSHTSQLLPAAFDFLELFCVRDLAAEHQSTRFMVLNDFTILILLNCKIVIHNLQGFEHLIIYPESPTLWVRSWRSGSPLQTTSGGRRDSGTLNKQLSQPYTVKSTNKACYKTFYN